ncbi:phage tail sheath subtilisin-like domain-containing protein [Pelosinus sp. IPA-1]|uniref:phage tail sheath subtilisin-like domain-containing protein n=1 Tax=Pelosinus sp. IPA-1 TaxID=3029569 RepID=UPI0024361952|nr:phage tail sheath subtilisin-like domain-containing protein [Pelosinus sp. IPA-1]GMB00218.1 tail protein [Pelosinus sp. IPA-1]
MPMEFIVPSVQIDESDVGARPTPQMSLAGIGIVGTFEKGPINIPTTVGDVNQLIEKFGGYKAGLTGYLSAYAALQQGANDFKIVRIAGTGAKAASVILKDDGGEDSFIVSASDPGVWGNDIKLNIEENTSTFRLTIICGEAKETFSALTLANLSIQSKFVTIAKLGNGNKLPKAVANVSLIGGNDGVAVMDADYIGTIDSSTGFRTGLKALEPVQVGIVLCAQQYSPAIQSALLSFVENCDIEEGLRVAILNTTPTLSVDAVVSQTTSLDSDRGILVYPWVEPEDLPGKFVAPDGYYAGRLSWLEPHKSPSNKQILGIISCENNYTYAEVKALTMARISPITLVNERGFRIRNGLTLASDPAWCQTNIRRQQDKMEMELYHAMQWAISEPHDERLWQDIATQIDMYLQVQKNLGLIRGYKPTLCNAQTNTPEMVTNRILTAIIRWLPLYAADFIILRFKRESSV